MTESMLTRMAKAIAYVGCPFREGTQRRERYWDDMDDDDQAYWLDHAKAALQAIREPELECRLSGKRAFLYGDVNPAADISVGLGRSFTAMIDHILLED